MVSFLNPYLRYMVKMASSISFLFLLSGHRCGPGYDEYRHYCMGAIAFGNNNRPRGRQDAYICRLAVQSFEGIAKVFVVDSNAPRVRFCCLDLLSYWYESFILPQILCLGKQTHSPGVC